MTPTRGSLRKGPGAGRVRRADEGNGSRQPQLPGGATPLSFRLAAAVDFGTEVKQALLESVSESERLGQLAAVVKTLLPRVAAQLKRSEAIRGNGKGM